MWYTQELGLGFGLGGFKWGWMALASNSLGFFFSFQCNIPASITGLDFCLFSFSSSHQICLHRRITRTEGEARSFSPFLKFYFGIHCLLFAKLLQFLFPSAHAACPAWGDTQCHQCQAWWPSIPCKRRGWHKHQPKAQGKRLCGFGSPCEEELLQQELS